jgi:sRNA-binding regulator protein Hfq
MTQRKLIRPRLSEVKEKQQKITKGKKPTPPEQTYAEIYYYQKQMHHRTPMVVALSDGEKIRGWIEWWDAACIKLNRHDGPNLLIPKHAIKYMYKDPEAPSHREPVPRSETYEPPSGGTPEES